MNIITILIIIIAVGSIIGAILLIKQSANKFELNEEQQRKVAQRKIEQQEKDQEMK